jgi:hypothetical protein
MPKKSESYETIISQIEHKLSPSSRIVLRKLGKGAMQENIVNTGLNIELHNSRQSSKTNQVVKRSQRLQKEQNQRSFSLQQVEASRRAKGEPIQARIAIKAEEKLIIAIPNKKPN